jgi:hypothetical protein
VRLSEPIATVNTKPTYDTHNPVLPSKPTQTRPNVSKTQRARATSVPFPEEQQQPVPVAEHMTAWPPLQFEKVNSTTCPAVQQVCTSLTGYPCLPACLSLNPLAPSSLHTPMAQLASQPAAITPPTSRRYFTRMPHYTASLLHEHSRHKSSHDPHISSCHQCTRVGAMLSEHRQ